MDNKKYDFVAIDCEKANNEPYSLCSIGIACFKGGRIQDTKEYIIKPYPFTFYDGSIVGGTYHHVPVEVYKNAPTLNMVWPKIKKFFDGNILVGHGINGDLNAIKSTLEYYGIGYDVPDHNECVCTNIASIYTYPNIESHKLKNLCNELDIDINPHHALSDAKAAGFLLLDMMNLTDCATVKDFVALCNEYNELITLNMTDNNIEKYEQKIKSYFDYSDEDIDLMYKSRMQLINKIFDFYDVNRGLNAKIEIQMCLSPIIELYRNPKYKDYCDEINKLMPFTHDSFLYLKLGPEKYVLFFGILMDKNTLIYDLLLFLSRCTIPVPRSSYFGVAYKRIIKYRETVNLLGDYLYYVEDFDDDDIFAYVLYLYMNQFELFKGYDLNRNYETMLNSKNENSKEIYKELMGKLAKLAGLYIGMKDTFSDRMKDVPKIDQFNGTFSLFDEICSLIEFENVEERVMNKYIDLIKKWYKENVEAIT